MPEQDPHTRQQERPINFNTALEVMTMLERHYPLIAVEQVIYARGNE